MLVVEVSLLLASFSLLYESANLVVVSVSYLLAWVSLVVV